MTGRTVEVVEAIGERHGLIKMDGEFWNARSETPIPVGDLCEIKRFEGLTIHVQPKQPKKG
jgi:membrane protein implicated in regulation of membrane protease activity